MRWGVWRLAVVLSLVLAPVACGAPTRTGTGIEVDEELVADLSLEDVERTVRPYDLSGSTAYGLALLDAWLLQDRPNRAAGYALRADVTMDLWTYTQLTEVAGDGEARAVLGLLSSRLGVSRSAAGGEAAWLQALREAVTRAVAGDLAEAGADEASVHGAEALMALDLSAEDAPERFPHGTEAALTSRGRLMLAALLYRVSREGAPGGSVLERFPWLCGEDRWSGESGLAERCGYYCATLPEPAPLAPPIERESHEISEDDTPIDWDVTEGPDGPAQEHEPEGDVSLWTPTPGDVGYELVQACGADYFGLPPTGGVVLLSPSNYLDMVLLSFVGDLLAGLELDLLDGDPLTVFSSRPLATFAGEFLDGAVREELTPAALRYDVRLELPRVWPLSAEGPGDRAGPELRLALVRSDGISLAFTPHLRLKRRNGGYEVAYAESDLGYHYPGATVFEFPRLNRIDPALVEADRLPRLGRALGEMEQAAVDLGWAPAARPDASECGVSPGTGISVLVDASTYFSTLRSVLGTLLDCGYSPIRLHAVERSGDRLADLDLDVTAQPSPDLHRLGVRNGAYVLRPAGAEESEAVAFDRSVENPLLGVVSAIQSGIAAGTIDPSVRLALVVEDERVDYGMLARIARVLERRRDLTGVTTDAELVEAPVVTSDGTPETLFDEPIVLLLE